MTRPKYNCSNYSPAPFGSSDCDYNNTMENTIILQFI